MKRYKRLKEEGTKNFSTESTNIKFDIVAPIAIYLFADLLFKSKAQKALSKMLKTYSFDSIKDLVVSPDVKSVTDLQGNNDWKRVYNDLFFNIASHAIGGGASKGVDKWGAFFIKKDGEQYFVGDDSGMFAWYEDSKGIKEGAKDYL